jgi:hypothetical protein
MVSELLGVGTKYWHLDAFGYSRNIHKAIGTRLLKTRTRLLEDLRRLCASIVKLYFGSFLFG